LALLLLKDLNLLPNLVQFPTKTMCVLHQLLQAQATSNQAPKEALSVAHKQHLLALNQDQHKLLATMPATKHPPKLFQWHHHLDQVDQADLADLLHLLQVLT
jgi:hypothetical protein